VTLKLYADEDCPTPVVKALRAAAYDVVAQQDVKRGAADDDVLRLSAVADRVLVTRDLGFGRLTVLDELPAVGVIIIRLRGKGDWATRAIRVVEAINELGSRAVGSVSTIDWHTTRVRPLPKKQQ
jgi:predicted nuclease of predicted toxin-antitoxin system